MSVGAYMHIGVEGKGQPWDLFPQASPTLFLKSGPLTVLELSK